MAGTSFIFSTVPNIVLNVYKTFVLNIMLCNLELEWVSTMTEIISGFEYMMLKEVYPLAHERLLK